MAATDRHFGNFDGINPFFPPDFLLLLGSQSPRRKEIVAKMDLPYRIVHIPFDESAAGTSDPVELAQGKNKAFREPLPPHHVLLTADTVVRLGDDILGKPSSIAEAKEMLRRLSGRTHTVETGVCLRDHSRMECFSEMTEIVFKPLAPDEIDYYAENYRPLDKAGAYGIQEWIGLIGIQSLRGDYYNVMGLPAARVWEKLRAWF